MADARNKTSTHFSSLESSFRTATSNPSEPIEGDFYYDTSANALKIYDGAKWKSISFNTTTSTSTSTTSTSTSTTSTSSSTTLSTSTSLTTSTSTTTTL